MFKTILIANRGEIACRIVKTCRRMGIRTVAVHSEADAGGLHVRMADVAVPIGAPPAAESYLRIERIVEACKATGAEAVHPGFGFLSERAAFADALKQAGIAFIGPDVPAIKAMGDKIESKKLASKAKVSTVPGFLGEVSDAQAAAKIAREIGYPVMIKASAGGGGKGMRIAYGDSELAQGLQSAANEAKAAFGDARVFIEKFIEQPRHIEIQVLGDKHGNTLYLWERECSIQRRHQKVIEEAPSPFLDEATRQAMGEQAVALAKAVGYHSAGTVEFIVGPDRKFYFLEMNTRLQVEHPVTEMITGLDIVEWMIRIAAGEKLSLRQQDLKREGWAMEARVYAEDPRRGFLPSIGRLTRFRPPKEEHGIRLDTGVFEGAEISMYYDPMIAKLVAHGANRADAIARLGEALDEFVVRGISHNVSFLRAVLAHPRFASGAISTGFIAEEYPDGYKADVLEDGAKRRLGALAAALMAMRRGRERGTAPTREFAVDLPGASWSAKVAKRDGALAVTLDGRASLVETAWRPGQPLAVAKVDGREMAVQVEPLSEGFRMAHGGFEATVSVRSRRAAELAARMPEKKAADGSRMLLSPMPGLVVSIDVKPGESVSAGQKLCVLDAMKMENVLQSPRDGKIAKIHAKKGDSLAVDQPILEFE
ncbi:MAG: acetyl/propionyl/methylcrotonyl-CoA carboxylase subunit alpha [Alphaproteobacteria bacterium]|nr:acetyl/propionyl/methylcrotonyl-CoA carboxylase subunit alpha [Alphaproteobacteria bacterium]